MYDGEASRTKLVIADDIVLERIEHTLGSGTGTLDFAVAGESEYYTWNGFEDADWSITGVERIENDDGDRVLIYPNGYYFRCEVTADNQEESQPCSLSIRVIELLLSRFSIRISLSVQGTSL